MPGPGSGRRGQRCPCPVLVSFLSGFSGKSCTVSLCCPDFLSDVRLYGFCFSRFCPLCGFEKKELSVVCQGSERAVRNFIVFFHRFLVQELSLLPGRFIIYSMSHTVWPHDLKCARCSRASRTEWLNSREILAVIHDFYFGNISQLLPYTTMKKRGLEKMI